MQVAINCRDRLTLACGVSVETDIDRSEMRGCTHHCRIKSPTSEHRPRPGETVATATDLFEVLGVRECDPRGRFLTLYLRRFHSVTPENS